MPPPNIRYANTPDGVSIAFHMLGSGPAVAILFPYHVNHLPLNWLVPLHRGAFEHLAQCFTVLNLDFRGAGNSERVLSSLSLDDFAEDLRSVLDSQGIELVALCALGDAALIACHFAISWPHRVSNMVFIGAGDSEANHRVLNLRHFNSTLEARLRGALLGGLGDEQNASALSAVARAALSSEALTLWEQLLHENQISLIASEVSVPVLWLHAADDQLVAARDTQAMVQSMQSAVLIQVPGRSGMDIWRHAGAVQALTQFIAKGFGLENEVQRAQRRRRKRRITYPAGLSPREAEVLRHVSAGRTNQQISAELCISLNTVSYHLRSIFNKTGSANRTEAASFAHRNGISALH